MTYVRIYSGSINAGDTVYNPGKMTTEKMARILKMHSNKRERINKASAGDIIAVMGLKFATTGDTLCVETNPILLEPMTFTEPVISIAVEPKKVQDQEKLMDSLNKLSEEDPTLTVHRDADTNETVISGLGETHLDVTAEKMLAELKKKS